MVHTGSGSSEYELKVGVNELIRSGPITGDRDLIKQLRGASSSAPRLIAEGYGLVNPMNLVNLLNWPYIRKARFRPMRPRAASGMSCVGLLSDDLAKRW